MLEMILIILGLIVFTCSFFIPAGKKVSDEKTETVSEDMIRENVEKEVEQAKSRISDIVDETITYAMEKTERSMDRLTNEKMMAVSDYADTVLEQINKNHTEVVFLYDMLNDKHENLKSTVSEAVKTASEVRQRVKDAEVTAKEAEERAREVIEIVEVQEFKPFEAERIEIAETEMSEQEFIGKLLQSEVQIPEDEQAAVRKRPGRKPKKVDGSEHEEVPEVAVVVDSIGRSGRNSNERILELHKAGKSNMAIAKELGLGIGEVKLVIDLFEGI